MAGCEGERLVRTGRVFVLALTEAVAVGGGDGGFWESDWARGAGGRGRRGKGD